MVRDIDGKAAQVSMISFEKVHMTFSLSSSRTIVAEGGLSSSLFSVSDSMQLIAMSQPTVVSVTSYVPAGTGLHNHDCDPASAKVKLKDSGRRECRW